MEILVEQNWNTCLNETEIETEIYCKTIIKTELKYIANNGIEIETKIYLKRIQHWSPRTPIKFQTLAEFNNFDHIR